MEYQRDKIYVFNKNKELLAIFEGSNETVNPEAGRNLIANPRIKTVQNGESIFSFQMIVNSEKWMTIRCPENLYYVNGRWYTPLNEGSYQYSGDGATRIVNVECVETFYLLARQYHQVYCSGLYCYAKGTFQGFSGDSLRFTISSYNCTNPGNTISAQNAWSQVKLWQPKDKDGNQLAYTILKDKEHAPTNWEDAPVSVAMESFSVSGNTATMVVKSTSTIETKKVFSYEDGGPTRMYQIDTRPYPSKLKSVQITSTTTTETSTPTSGGGTKYHRKIVTSTKEVNYLYNNIAGRCSLMYEPAQNEEISSVIITYEYSNLGDISSGATCWFAYGAEVVDEHTFLVLPKADKKYKLTIDGIEYDDSQVRDSRGFLMPRGSAGYAMWAALRNTGWQLGICDVLPKGFNADIDYGSFNCESDMKDTLYNIEMIAELYGGLLCWDSNRKVLDYRADVTSLNSGDYQVYNDGFNQWTGYEFREGKNVTDQPDITCDNNLITKGYILGYNNLNIKKVNGGRSYVTDFSYTNQVFEGYLEQPLIYDTRDEGGMKQLLYWGQKEIKKKSRPRQTFTYHVTDIRTVEGMEHEVFDINDICRAYFRDTESGQEVYVETRVISWEYNPFAYWDCTVELGDKTTNLSELFRLVYNKAVEEAPKTNASGQIPISDIVFEYDWEEFGLPDIPGITPIVGGGGGGIWGGGGGYGGTTLNNYISLIARQVTENSEAIAGLILEATDLYARAELFSQYQKITDDRIAETYAGLKTYADEWGSNLSLEVRGAYESIRNVDGELQRFETVADGYFKMFQEEDRIGREERYRFEQAIYGKNGLIERVSGLYQDYIEITRDYATKQETLKWRKELQDSIVEASNTVKLEINENYAKKTDLLQYVKTDQFGNLLAQSKNTIDRWVSDNSSITTLQNNTKTALDTANNAKQAANDAQKTANNTSQKFTTYMSCVTSAAITGQSYSRISAVKNGTYGASVTVSSNGNTVIAGNGTCTISGNVKINGALLFPLTIGSYRASWKTVTISGTTINYLGR